MNRRTGIGLIVGVGILIGLLVWLTGEGRLWGGWIGFAAGSAESQWLFRDLRIAANQELTRALKRYVRGLFVRWGLISLFIYATARWWPEWLLAVTAGVAVGIIATLVWVILSTLSQEKGGEK